MSFKEGGIENAPKIKKVLRVSEWGISVIFLPQVKEISLKASSLTLSFALPVSEGGLCLPFIKEIVGPISISS